jgi:integrase
VIYEMAAAVARTARIITAAGRLDQMDKTDYIFPPLSDVGMRLAQRKAEKNGRAFRPSGVGHLSGARINAIIKSCARRAGLDESRIHTHILRHTAADLFLELGGDLMDLQEFLHHSNISTTRIYVTRRKERTARHPLWKSVGAFFEMV